MNTQKKILVIGGTGAMGVYLVPELAAKGYKVDVLSLDEMTSTNPLVTYIKGTARDASYMKEFLKTGYDAIVDFMIYNTAQFRESYEMLLSATDHYIYLSSYRIYADKEHPIKETSPRLLDVSDDADFLATEDYSLYKARGEDILKASRFKNWTAVRPAITYSKFRYQLVTLEAPVVIYRALKGLPVVLPKEAMKVQSTMTWAGDVAKMFAGIILNPSALCEIYTLSTAEHNTWETVASYYKELIGLEYVTVDTEDYINMFSNKIGAGYQLRYDRLFDRIVDNTKILTAAGLKQSELTTLHDGLARELAAYPRDHVWPKTDVNDAMDNLLKTIK